MLHAVHGCYRWRRDRVLSVCSWLSMSHCMIEVIENIGWGIHINMFIPLDIIPS